MSTPITRENIDNLLDSGRIEIAMRNGNWWKIRRNGATKHWKREATRIYVPFKHGIYGYGNVAESDFCHGPDGNALNPIHFRVAGND